MSTVHSVRERTNISRAVALVYRMDSWSIYVLFLYQLKVHFRKLSMSSFKSDGESIFLTQENWECAIYWLYINEIWGLETENTKTQNTANFVLMVSLSEISDEELVNLFRKQ